MRRSLAVVSFISAVLAFQGAAQAGPWDFLGKVTRSPAAKPPLEVIPELLPTQAPVIEMKTWRADPSTNGWNVGWRITRAWEAYYGNDVAYFSEDHRINLIGQATYFSDWWTGATAVGEGGRSIVSLNSLGAMDAAKCPVESAPVCDLAVSKEGNEFVVRWSTRYADPRFATQLFFDGENYQKVDASGEIRVAQRGQQAFSLIADNCKGNCYASVDNTNLGTEAYQCKLDSSPVSEGSDDYFVQWAVRAP